MPPGPVTAFAVIPPYGHRSATPHLIGTRLDLGIDDITVGEFFTLDRNRRRTIFEPLYVALIHHHLDGVVSHTAESIEEDEFDGSGVMCGCCAKGAKRPFGQCRTAIFDGKVYLNGTCTNCFGRGAELTCSMTREFLTFLQTSNSEKLGFLLIFLFRIIASFWLVIAVVGVR